MSLLCLFYHTLKLLTISKCHFIAYRKGVSIIMYKNKALNGKNNICGRKIKTLRKQLDPKVSQRSFAERLQLNGIDLDKNAIQRIESGQRFVTDIELKEFAKILNILMNSYIL